MHFKVLLRSVFRDKIVQCPVFCITQNKGGRSHSILLMAVSPSTSLTGSWDCRTGLTAI